MHGDHIYGLIGLLATCGLAGNPTESIYMAHQVGWISELVVVTLRPIFLTHQVHTVQPGVLYEDEEFTVSCGRLEHRVTTLATGVAEKTVQGALMSKSEGTFDSSGRVYGQLKGWNSDAARWAAV